MNKVLQYAATLLIGLLLSTAGMAEDDEPGEGQMAPDFKLTRFDGSQFKLSEYRGKKSVYLVFWNTWCTYCMKKIPKLIDAQEHLSNEIEIIAVNTTRKDTMEKSLAFQNRFNISYPLAFDYGETVTDLYGVWGTPTEFIIDVNGVIQHRDGVPENLRAHLASWNNLDDTSQLVDSKSSECNQEQQTC